MGHGQTRVYPIENSKTEKKKKIGKIGNFIAYGTCNDAKPIEFPLFGCREYIHRRTTLILQQWLPKSLIAFGSSIYSRFSIILSSITP